MEASPVYREIRPRVERVLNAVVCEDFAQCTRRDAAALASALAWNIERGIRFEGIVDALRNHPELKDKDLLLLTELDYGMARSGNLFVARELAKELKLNYAFAPVYIALQKGSGVEEFAEGENTRSLHGLAMFSKYPMQNLHAISLPNGKDKMWGKEKRLGHLRALVADIDHPAGQFRAVTIHLDAHCSRAHRRRQMKIILDHLETLAADADADRRRLEHDDVQFAKLDAGHHGLLETRFYGPENVATKSPALSGDDISNDDCLRISKPGVSITRA